MHSWQFILLTGPKPVWASCSVMYQLSMFYLRNYMQSPIIQNYLLYCIFRTTCCTAFRTFTKLSNIWALSYHCVYVALVLYTNSQCNLRPLRFAVSLCFIWCHQ